MSKDKTKKFLKVVKKVLGIISGVILALVFLLLCVAFVSRFAGGDGSVLGFHINVIATGSMEPEIMVGDIIISRTYNGQKLEAGDVITYVAQSGEKKGQYITHEVITTDGEGDELVVTTKGVANPTADAPIEAEHIVSVMIYNTKVIKYIYRVLIHPVGFWVLIILPLAASFIAEIVTLVKQLKKEEKEKKAKQELDRQAIIEQFIKEQELEKQRLEERKLEEQKLEEQRIEQEKTENRESVQEENREK